MKIIVLQNYKLRVLIRLIYNMVLIFVGLLVFYYWGATYINHKTSNGLTPFIEMFSGGMNWQNSAYLLSVFVYAYLLLLFHRLICPELTLKINNLIKKGNYTLTNDSLLIHAWNQKYEFLKIDEMKIISPDDYDPANAAWGIIPKRVMMDGAIIIKGDGEQCTLYFCGDIDEEVVSCTEMEHDILRTFNYLCLDKDHSNRRVKKYIINSKGSTSGVW